MNTPLPSQAKHNTSPRRTIALNLASGLLQLYDTSWLPEAWTLDDIYMEPGNLNNIYIKQTFHLNRSFKPPQRQKTLDTFGIEVVKNKSVFSLAVALLELTYNRPLASFRTDRDLNDGLTSYRIATRLTEKLHDHEPERFRSIVYHCMNPRCGPTQYDFSFSNEGFRRQFITDVLLPLKQDVNTLTGGAPAAGYGQGFGYGV